MNIYYITSLFYYSLLTNINLAAKKALQRAIECLPPTPYVHMQLASIDNVLGLREEAIAMYKSALELSKDLVPALIGMAVSVVRVRACAMP